MVNIVSSYTAADIEANECLSRCQHCGGDIFYLKIFQEARTWWHEVLELDFEHKAEPIDRGEL